MSYYGDWTQIRMRWSELEYSGAQFYTYTPSEFAVVQITSPTGRFQQKVVYDGDASVRPMLGTGAPLDPSLSFGTGSFTSSDNKSWAVSGQCA